MGNTLPISATPAPSASRAVIIMVPQSFRTYLKEPWRRPVGKLQLVGTRDELPAALNGVVSIETYIEMMSSVDSRASNYRGGLVTIAAALFQACCLLVIILGFFVSKFLVSGFFHPITLAVFAAAEFCVLYYSGRLYRGEERKLTQDLLALFHPWRQEYGITAKIRKMTGQIAVERGGGLVTATYFCLVLEKTMSANDNDTASLSAQTETDMGSDIDSQV